MGQPWTGEKSLQNFSRKAKGREQLGDLGVYTKTTLMWIFKEWLVLDLYA
jgi:hypothetical protein